MHRGHEHVRKGAESFRQPHQQLWAGSCPNDVQKLPMSQHIPSPVVRCLEVLSVTVCCLLMCTPVLDWESLLVCKIGTMRMIYCRCNLSSSLVFPVGRPAMLGNARQTPFDDRQCSLQQHLSSFPLLLSTEGRRSRVIHPLLLLLLLLLSPFYSHRCWFLPVWHQHR